MQDGLLGYSLLFELFALYLIFTFIWDKVEKRWLYTGLLVLGVIVFSGLTSGRWVDILSGHFEFLWNEIFSNFGFTGN
mgnify:CR=1 FL=1